MSWCVFLVVFRCRCCGWFSSRLSFRPSTRFPRFVPHSLRSSLFVLSFVSFLGPFCLFRSSPRFSACSAFRLFVWACRGGGSCGGVWGGAVGLSSGVARWRGVCRVRRFCQLVFVGVVGGFWFSVLRVWRLVCSIRFGGEGGALSYLLRSSLRSLSGVECGCGGGFVSSLTHYARLVFRSVLASRLCLFDWRPVSALSSRLSLRVGVSCRRVSSVSVLSCRAVFVSSGFRVVSSFLAVAVLVVVVAPFRIPSRRACRVAAYSVPSGCGGVSAVAVRDLLDVGGAVVAMVAGVSYGGTGDVSYGGTGDGVSDAPFLSARLCGLSGNDGVVDVCWLWGRLVFASRSSVSLWRLVFVSRLGGLSSCLVFFCFRFDWSGLIARWLFHGDGRVVLFLSCRGCCRSCCAIRLVVVGSFVVSRPLRFVLRSRSIG